MRSAAVVAFIAIVAAVALYCAQRPTVARGSVIAAELVELNPILASLSCEDRIPIGVQGATFKCAATFKSGNQVDYTFKLDREGKISVVEQGETRAAPRIKKTTDPWGD